MQFFNKKNLALTVILAMLYFGLKISLKTVPFGVAQFRFSECLTILPIFTPQAIFGLTIGCFISNFYSFLNNGVDGSMPIDILLGSLAAFLAGCLTYLIGKNIKSKVAKYLLAPLPTVFLKTLVVGCEITIFYGGNLVKNLLDIGFAEFVVCYVLGVPLMFFLYKDNIYKKIFN